MVPGQEGGGERTILMIDDKATMAFRKENEKRPENRSFQVVLVDLSGLKSNFFM